MVTYRIINITMFQQFYRMSLNCWEWSSFTFQKKKFFSRSASMADQKSKPQDASYCFWNLWAPCVLLVSVKGETHESKETAQIKLQRGGMMERTKCKQMAKAQISRIKGLGYIDKLTIHTHLPMLQMIVMTVQDLTFTYWRIHRDLPVISFVREQHIQLYIYKSIEINSGTHCTLWSQLLINTARTDTGPFSSWTKALGLRSRSNQCPSWGRSLLLDILQQLRPPLVNLLPASPQPLLSSLLLPCESSRFCSLFFQRTEPFSFLVLPTRKSDNKLSHILQGNSKMKSIKICAHMFVRTIGTLCCAFFFSRL